MHIITSFLIAMVVKNLKKDPGLKGLPRLNTGPIRLAHAIPGRLRFNVPALRGCDSSVLETLDKIRSLPGVENLEVNRISGSVLIHYTPKTIEPMILLMVLARVLGVEKELNHPPTPALTRGVKNVGKSLNRAVYEEAHGLIDLQSIIVIALIIMGGKKIWQDRWAAFPAGVTLVWWAMHTINAGKGELPP